MQNDPQNCSLKNDIILLKVELWNLYRAKEHSWHQKSRIRWFLDGDRNTKFLHTVASNIRKVNWLDRVNVNGNILSDPKSIFTFVVDYFENHFKKQVVSKVVEFNCPLNSLDFTFATSLE